MSVGFCIFLLILIDNSYLNYIIFGAKWDEDKWGGNGLFGDSPVKEIELASYKWTISVKGQNPDNEDYSHEFTFEWENLPKKVQAEIEQRYPVCKCGKYRYQASEHFECYSCRDYRDCPRCSKEEQYFGADRIKNGATCCQNCGEWYEGREEWIHNHLSTDDLQKIRNNAQTLLDAPVFCDLEDCSGEVLYPLLDGTYTSRFDDETLTQLVNLPDSGNSLVELIWWVARGSKQSGLSSSFTEETITELKNKLDAGENVTARFVRASDEVIKAVDDLRDQIREHFEYGSLKITDPNPFSDTDKEQIEAQWSEANSGNPTITKLDILHQLQKILVDEVNEYRAKIEAERQNAAKWGEIWLDVSVEISTRSQCHTSVFCIASDGSLVEPKSNEGYYGDISTTHLVLKHETSTYNYMYSEEWEVICLPKKVTQEQTQTVNRLEDEVQRYFCGKDTGWDLSKVGVVAYTTVYTRDLGMEDHQMFDDMRESFPVNVNEYESWIGEDPVYGGVHEINENTVVIGFHKKDAITTDSADEMVKTNQSTGYWSPTDHKHWYHCPQGHSEKIKKS